MTCLRHENQINCSVERVEHIIWFKGISGKSCLDRISYQILSLLTYHVSFCACTLQETLQFEYDLECIINDWVFLGFLIGNDFIPHLPHIHIQHQCLPLLWQTYINVLPTLDGKLIVMNTTNTGYGSKSGLEIYNMSSIILSMLKLMHVF